jgi:hypothetical protein
MWCSRPNAHQLTTSIRTTRTFRPDAHQCLETSNCQDCICLDVMANRPAAIKSSRRIQCPSASIRTTWQYRPDTIQCWTSNRVSVSDTDMGRHRKPSERCGVPVLTLSLVRQVVQQKCNLPDARATPSGRGLVMEAFNAILKRRLSLTVQRRLVKPSGSPPVF